MRYKYVASIGTPKEGRREWAENDNSCFEKVKKLDAYAEEIYFYPTSHSENVWLYVLGHEKATRDKATINRMWTSWWGVHVCVGGKGYYNDVPITKGMCFISWPYVKHDIVADKDDPFEFYWLIMSGLEITEFANNCGFNDSHVVFKLDHIDEIVNLFELGMNTNYANVDVKSYTMGLVRMILSFHKPQTGDIYNVLIDDTRRNYTRMVEQLLKHNNYTLSVLDLSKEIGVTAKHLSKVFYKDTGEHLKKYIIRKKFDFAAKLITNGIAPTEISVILKYSNYSAFHKMFVARFGMSPTEYSEIANSSDGSNS